MIQTESITINGKLFVRTYSDEGKYVVRDGVSYEEAVDPADKGRTYSEGDYIVDQNHIDDDIELTDDEVARILTGGEL